MQHSLQHSTADCTDNQYKKVEQKFVLTSYCLLERTTELLIIIILLYYTIRRASYCTTQSSDNSRNQISPRHAVLSGSLRRGIRLWQVPQHSMDWLFPFAMMFLHSFFLWCNVDIAIVFWFLLEFDCIHDIIPFNNTLICPLSTAVMTTVMGFLSKVLVAVMR